ncbi:MAG: NUDIX domain-containing protein [Candidatus Komeilibacteria bacterium]|nr:NUDIX domain-containing protein [Candidatus Komeilibacteria bacterium]
MTKERYKFIAAVHLILQKDNKILLSRRFNTGYEDGNYSVVAGHIDANERAKTAMIREAKEESGIEINEDDLETIHVMHRKGDDHERINFFMRAKNWQGEPTILEVDKCDDLNWFELDRLPNSIVPYIKFALENIKNGNFYSEFDW